MAIYLRNASNFAVDCAVNDGQCEVAPKNFHFIDDPQETTAVSLLQLRCGNVVIAPDPVDPDRAWLYLTSCARMGDVAEQIFSGHLQPATPVATPSAEMSVGQLQRRRLDLAFRWCRARVDGFAF